ncbi:MAG: ASCH domain-containing protein [Deltaproteobacteria bacterium]|nr:ASCH domain-containing protein [Deltaproteobacteria bacterium]
MKALTIWQPWASLIVRGPKRIENRSWVPPRWLIGQRIGIHAGKKAVAVDGLMMAEYPELAELLRDPLPLGALVGSAIVAGVETGAGPRKDDRFFEGPAGWILEDVVPLPDPIPMRGAQGLWDLPDDAASAIQISCSMGGTRA